MVAVLHRSEIVMNFLRKQRRPDDERQQLIRTEMAFLLERDERWFEKQLQARLLDEGCNFPMILAKPLFYKRMLSELQKIVPEELRPKFQAIIPDSLEARSSLTHPVFHNAIRFCASKCHDSAMNMALGVTKTIQAIVEQWQLPSEMFQEDFPQFSNRVSVLASTLWEKQDSPEAQEISFELIRRRLYLSLTTSLLSKMNTRQAFEKEFGSIPAVLQTMQEEHSEFCRFMNFCQDRSPYFLSIVSRSFWRTLETLFLEQRRDAA